MLGYLMLPIPKENAPAQSVLDLGLGAALKQQVDDEANARKTKLQKMQPQSGMLGLGTAAQALFGAGV